MHVALDFGSIPHAQAYDVLVSTIHPRPIAFVSTVSAEGHQNLSPFSFFMVGGSNPPSLAFSPSLGSRGEKDTLRNMRETKEFVVNLVHRAMAEAMNSTSKYFPPEISEWEVAGLTPAPSLRVTPPRVAESQVQLECRLFEIAEHGHEPGSARYVIGEVLVAHLAPGIWNGESVEQDKVRPIARMGGPNYLDTEALEFFQMLRPL
ncbi:MAG TPA: flavin reductase family protein [Fimbriimonadaceae bacterium]|nr:flavin reductase family protein [Fimbriimonadaceae bacterium]